MFIRVEFGRKRRKVVRLTQKCGNIGVSEEETVRSVIVK